MAELELEFDLWPRQMQALQSKATEILFGGESEGGKSHLVRVASIAACLAIPGLQCTLVRKKFDDILKNHVHGRTGYNSLLAPLIESGSVVSTEKGIKFLENGSNIHYQHCQDERQFTSAQGVETHFLIIDEATQITERLIRTFRTWVRMPPEFKASIADVFKDMFPRILYTANPIGPSVPFFRRHFIKARAPFEMQAMEGFIRQFIPSGAADNKSVDMAVHNARIEGLGDQAMIRALKGNWDAPLGDYFPEYDEEKHVIPDFTPPAHWFRFRSFDWGTAEPFACYWFAVSDGESFTDELNRMRWYPRGALIAYREWYGCDPENPDKGLRMRNEDVALGIKERSPAECEKKIITISDSLPFQDRGGKTIAQTFEEYGVLLLHGDTSRIPGWSQLRSRLIGKKIDSNDKEPTPMLYLVSSCKYARDYLPALPRHITKPEDAAESGETTHAADAIRLACMARAYAKDLPAVQPDTANLKNEITFDKAILKIKQHKMRENESTW